MVYGLNLIAVQVPVQGHGEKGVAMTDDSIATRLHVEARLQPGATVGLGHDRAHFLRSVLRLKAGRTLALFNAADGEWLARIDGLGRGWCSLVVLECRRGPERTPDLWLVFAPIKRARLDFLVEKATELGCARLQPVFTRHTAVSRVNVERLRSNVREAAEQCERITLPEVCEPVTLEVLLADWPTDRRLLVAVEAGAAPPIDDVLAEAGRDEPWAVLVGPEGGFSAAERKLLAAPRGHRDARLLAVAGGRLASPPGGQGEMTFDLKATLCISKCVA
jgi:16S rRNA (uracil1498-N3)-methyltransferase